MEARDVRISVLSDTESDCVKDDRLVWLVKIETKEQRIPRKKVRIPRESLVFHLISTR